MSAGYALATGIDVAAATEAYRRDGHVRLQPFLAPGQAERLADFCREADRWRTVFNAGERVYELDAAARAKLTAEQFAALERGIHADARDGFQFHYASIRVPDEAAARAVAPDALSEFATFLSTDPVRDLLRTITAHDDIAFADAQATRFDAGHFLTGHDDEVAGKGRRAAYTFGLSPRWRPEWGGLLLFHDAVGDVSRGLAPAFNALSLFRVPQLHSVSSVTPAAAAPRLSITGWLRGAG